MYLDEIVSEIDGLLGLQVLLCTCNYNRWLVHVASAFFPQGSYASNGCSNKQHNMLIAMLLPSRNVCGTYLQL